MKISNMKTQNRQDPLGIDIKNPSFSWNIETKQQDWIQEAYRILVSDNKEELKNDIGKMWDSKRVNLKNMNHILYEGSPLVSNSQYFWKVFVWKKGKNEPTVSNISCFTTGLFDQSDWQGKWIGEKEDRVNHIYRKQFEIEKEVEQASLFVCGLGHYELHMNNEKVSDHVLEPGWTNYDKSCLYSSYDVTDFLNKGNNAIGVYLGDGMYNVPGGRYVYFERSYGKMKLLLQLNIKYVDGTRDEIVTDESWNHAPSPLTFSCIYGGEDYDARLEQRDFSDPDFPENSTWKAVSLVEAPKGKLVSQSIEPLKVMQTYKPVKVEEIKPGLYLYDLGRNFSGWINMKLRNQLNNEGKVVALTPGEILKKDKTPNQKVTGEGYQWKYILNNKEIQSYSPKFTYTGFRYVLVEGAIPKEFARETTKLPIIESLMGEFIYPDIEVAGEFNCSNQLFNQIHKIVTQAMLSNIKSVFTDCPHREKLGWLEETHLIGPSIMYNFDVQTLYEKIEDDMAQSQHESGLVPDISPEYVTGFDRWHEGFLDSPEWGSACIINPWHLYKKYGNTKVFTKHYSTMKKYMDYLTSKTHHHMLHHGLGDWLDIGPNTPHSQNTPVPVIATAIYYYDLSIMSKVAKILGYDKDSKYYSDLMVEVKKEYNLQYYDDQTYRYATGSQAAQAMSLVVGLVEEDQKEKVLGYLVTDIEKRNYATTAGDVGHPFVLAALTIYNRSDVINKMTNVTDAPGYGYQVKCGATTLAEEWDGPDPENPHGSQNHFMLGSIGEWFYSGLAGIKSVRTDKNFDDIIIQPHFAEGCDKVEAWTMHPYGKIDITWVRTGQEIQVDLQIPANVTAIFISELDFSERKFGSGKYSFSLIKD